MLVDLNAIILLEHVILLTAAACFIILKSLFFYDQFGGKGREGEVE